MPIENIVLIAGLAFFAVAFAVFSIRQLSYGRDHNPRVQKDGGSVFFGGTYMMDFAYWMLNPVVKTLVALKVTPNMISLICLVVSVLSGVAFAYGEFMWAGLIWFLGSSFDALDGSVARHRGMVSKAGSVIDSTVDRVAEVAVYSGLAIYYRFDVLFLSLTVIALGGSFLTSYISAKSEILRVEIPRGVMRRAERAVYIGVAAILTPFFDSFLGEAYQSQHLLMVAVLLIIAVFANLSSAYRLHALCKKLDS